MKPDLSYENSYYPKLVIGIDEAGRGPLAGPVVAAAVHIHDTPKFQVNDSKKLSPKSRADLYELITSTYKYSVSIIDREVVDDINILNATMSAMKEAAEHFDENYSVVLVDGNRKPKIEKKEVVTIVKGDSKSFSIAAASIVAKVTRDEIMRRISKEFPNYNWEKNMGYGTAEHIESIKKFGLCKYHRRSFTKKLVA